MMDAVRMLPVLGMVLFLLPGLWLPAESHRPDTGRGGLYLFAIWAGLVVIAFGLARGLASGLEEEERTAEYPGEEEDG